MADKVSVAVLGPGNIGSDLLVKLLRSETLEPVLMVGIDPDSPGLAQARAAGVEASADGVEAILADETIQIVFDATGAGAHRANAPRLVNAGKRVVDLTPAALGPYVVPAVNLTEHLDAPDVNMVTCGGQATIPIVHAIARAVERLDYAEIVATIASAGAGPGTRANIDEFTQTTARALEVVGGATTGKAIIVLNPADPPIMMRDTVHARATGVDEEAVRASVTQMVEALAGYVPGYRLLLCEVDGDQVTVMSEIEGAGDFLPAYAGNLDIMTSAAARVGDELARWVSQTVVT